jgi:hypothetical protein
MSEDIAVIQGVNWLLSSDFMYTYINIKAL